MAFLVRKINGRAKLPSLLESTIIENIYADIPTTEFRTSKGTLSTWRIQTLDELEDAVLAIATTSSEISKMDFIIMDMSLLDSNGLEYKQTYAGREIPIPDLQDAHYDITGITLKKLSDCANVFKTIYANEGDEEKYIVRFTEHQIKEILKNAIQERRIDESKATGKIRDEIKKITAA